MHGLRERRPSLTTRHATDALRCSFRNTIAEDPRLWLCQGKEEQLGGSGRAVYAALFKEKALPSPSRPRAFGSARRGRQLYQRRAHSERQPSPRWLGKRLPAWPLDVRTAAASELSRGSLFGLDKAAQLSSAELLAHFFATHWIAAGRRPVGRAILHPMMSFHLKARETMDGLPIMV